MQSHFVTSAKKKKWNRHSFASTTSPLINMNRDVFNTKAILSYMENCTHVHIPETQRIVVYTMLKADSGSFSQDTLKVGEASSCEVCPFHTLYAHVPKGWFSLTYLQTVGRRHSMVGHSSLRGRRSCCCSVYSGEFRYLPRHVSLPGTMCYDGIVPPISLGLFHPLLDALQRL